MNDSTLFQYCQKLVLFRNKNSEILLARRKDEADFNATYALIGGKLEKNDGSLLAGIKREKDEEIGLNVVVRICPTISYNVYFVKSNGSHMVLPHYYAEYVSGEIQLSDEYEEYKWITVKDLENFSPKISTIPAAVEWALRVKKMISSSDLITI